MRALLRFGRFWYDFIVGEEWVIAVVAVLAVGATAFATRLGWSTWPLLPLAVVGTLALSACAWCAAPRRPETARAAGPRSLIESARSRWRWLACRRLLMG
jgi:hypothetical protein